MYISPQNETDIVTLVFLRTVSFQHVELRPFALRSSSKSLSPQLLTNKSLNDDAGSGAIHSILIMIRQIALCSFLAASIDAFAPSSNNVPLASITFAGPAAPQPMRHLSTLYSEAEDASSNEEETAAAEGENTAAAAPAAVDASDILNSPAFLKRKVEVLQSDLAALQKEIEEANAVYLAGKEEWGPKFDMINKESQAMQERLAKQGSQGKETATVEVATSILNVLDNYDRAFQAVEAATNEEVEIVDAYKHTYDLIIDALTDLNVTKVETVGVEFNYELHQAMMQMPSDEYEEGIVCQEFAPGWAFGEKCIRPAMVAVAL